MADTSCKAKSTKLIKDDKISGNKTCKSCSKSLPLSDFYEGRKTCKKCHNKTCIENRTNNSLNVKNNQTIIAGGNVYNNYTTVVQQNIQNNLYIDCSVNVEIYAPINEYNKLQKNYMDNYSKYSEDLNSLYNEFDCTNDKTEKRKINKKIQSIRKKLTPVDEGYYLKQFEDLRNKYRYNKNIPTKQDIESLKKKGRELLKPNDEENDFYVKQDSDNDIFKKKADMFLETITYYDFDKVNSKYTRTLFKIIKAISKKNIEIKEEDFKFEQAERRRYYQKKEEEEENKKEKRLQEFLSISEDAELIELSNDLELDNWYILRKFKKIKSVNITNNKYLTTTILKEIAGLKFYTDIELIYDEDNTQDVAFINQINTLVTSLKNQEEQRIKEEELIEKQRIKDTLIFEKLNRKQLKEGEDKKINKQLKEKEEKQKSLDRKKRLEELKQQIKELPSLKQKLTREAYKVQTKDIKNEFIKIKKEEKIYNDKLKKIEMKKKDDFWSDDSYESTSDLSDYD
jgi:hypothetical protein